MRLVTRGVKPKLDYRLGKKVLQAIGNTQLEAINKIPIARLALEANYGPGSVTSAMAASELIRLKKQMRDAPFDRNLQQQFSRVLALFGVDYPMNKALDKRMQRLAKKRAIPYSAGRSVSLKNFQKVSLL